MKAIFSGVEALFYQHRFALLWMGYLVGCGLLAKGVLAAGGMVGDVPYPIREMLINYGDGLVRRGLSGQVVIWGAQVFGGGVVLWAFGLSCLMAGVLFALVLGLYRRLATDCAHLPLLLAPWGLLFFTYDPGGSFRKEILGYIALSLILRGAFAANVQRAMIWATGGAVVFVAMLFAHEGLAMMAPALLLSVGVLCWQFPQARGYWGALAAVSAVLSGGVVLYLGLLPLRDPDVLCAAIGDLRCGVPFAWVGRGFAEGAAYTIGRRAPQDVPIFGGFLLLAVLPLAGFRVPGWSRGAHWRVFAMCAVVIAPLFVSAYDWGRWIQMLVLPLSLVGLAAVALGRAQYRRVLPAWAVVLYIASHALPHANLSVLPLLLPLYMWPGVLGLVLVRRMRTGQWGWEAAS